MDIRQRKRHCRGSPQKIMTAARITLAAALAALFLATPTDLVSCGPSIPQAAFVAKHGPLYPAEDYARNYIGIVDRKWRTEPLIVAWRYFSGLNLSAAELDAMYINRRESTAIDSDTPPHNPIDIWLKARSIVPNVNAVSHLSYDSINASRTTITPTAYINFQNCLDDAFLTATATLTARAKQWGADDNETKDWLTAQDIVFSNCSGPAAEPALAPRSASALLKADRAYQFAAASFYAGAYDQAHKRFLAIAKDTASPWHPIAPYLAARATLRDATVNEKGGKLAEAARELAAIHTPAAQQLLQFANVRLHREESLVTLATCLSQARLGPHPSQLFTDFRFTFINDETGMPRVTKVTTPLTDWLQFWRNPPDSPATLANWRKHPDIPWLIAALSSVNPQDSAVPELLAAARKIDLRNPAFPSVAYYAARLSNPSDARNWIARALTLKLNDSDYNQFLATRLALARNFDDFLRDAPRKLSLSAIDDDPTPISPTDPELRRFLNGRAFDYDSVNLWNTHVPLPRWQAAAKGTKLPSNLRTDLARTGWVRSVVANRPDDARAFLELWRQLSPTAAQPAIAYLTSPTGFTAAKILLQNPGFSPILLSGFGRLTKPNARDIFRDNWWCPLAKPEQPLKVPAYLPQTQTPDSLATKRAASDFIPTEVVSYAKAHPDDPAIPELLARSLDVAHYSSCLGLNDSKPSRQAFELLKLRYPNTKWARQTKYWYRN